MMVVVVMVENWCFSNGPSLHLHPHVHVQVDSRNHPHRLTWIIPEHITHIHRMAGYHPAM